MTDSLVAPGFLFSQHSLNTYARCKRRFLLKYVDRQPWPMPEEEDPRSYQDHLARGRVFHQWLVREHLGLDMTSIVEACDDELLQAWWAAWQSFDREALPRALREAELPIVVPLGRHRLYARYDYLALDRGGEAVIVDWKTLGTVPPLSTLRQRFQTRVYLYCLVSAGHVFSGGQPLAPDQVSMLYWFANTKESISIPYSVQSYVRDGRDLLRMTDEIASQARDAFVRTDDLRQCMRCNYRSLCQRENERLETSEEWLDEDLDLDLDLELANVQDLDY